MNTQLAAKAAQMINMGVRYKHAIVALESAFPDENVHSAYAQALINAPVVGGKTEKKSKGKGKKARKVRAESLGNPPVEVAAPAKVAEKPRFEPAVFTEPSSWTAGRLAETPLRKRDEKVEGGSLEAIAQEQGWYWNRLGQGVAKIEDRIERGIASQLEVDNVDRVRLIGPTETIRRVIAETTPFYINSKLAKKGEEYRRSVLNAKPAEPVVVAPVKVAKAKKSKAAKVAAPPVKLSKKAARKAEKAARKAAKAQAKAPKVVEPAVAETAEPKRKYDPDYTQKRHEAMPNWAEGAIKIMRKLEVKLAKIAADESLSKAEKKVARTEARSKADKKRYALDDGRGTCGCGTGATFHCKYAKSVTPPMPNAMESYG
jgi:hypothetical protein